MKILKLGRMNFDSFLLHPSISRNVTFVTCPKIKVWSMFLFAEFDGESNGAFFKVNFLLIKKLWRYLLVGQEHYSVPKVAILESKIDPLKIVFIKFLAQHRVQHPQISLIQYLHH